MDFPTTSAIYKLTPAEATQSQTGDAPSTSFLAPVYYITPGEASQLQTMDLPGVGAVYVIDLGEGFQDQQMDAADARLPFTPPSGIGTRYPIYADGRAEIVSGRRTIHVEQRADIEPKRG